MFTGEKYTCRWQCVAQNTKKNGGEGRTANLEWGWEFCYYKVTGVQLHRTTELCAIVRQPSQWSPQNASDCPEAHH